MPAGYVSHTGYQYDSISRVAGQRELAPPSKFSNEGGFRKSVFRGIDILVHFTIGRVSHGQHSLAARPKLVILAIIDLMAKCLIQHGLRLKSYQRAASSPLRFRPLSSPAQAARCPSIG